MRILIYDEKLSGHHLEYLQHYCQAAENMRNEEFIICVPEVDYIAKKDYLPCSSEDNNISYDLIPDIEVQRILSGSPMRYGYRKAVSVADKAKKNKADYVFLTDFITTIPFLLLLMPKDVKVRGIIYRIYLYLKGKISPLRYVFDTLCFWLMAKSRVMDRVFILNDEASSKRFNSIHHTNKFMALADPVTDIDMTKLKNMRDEMNVPVGNTIYFHFGALAERKGTLEILKAIILADSDALRKKSFVFAGVVRNDIRDQFYSLLDKAKDKSQIIVFDEFCSYEKLNSLCYTSDVILMPYRQTELSSGVLGYAAQLGKPVIGPKDGLIGKLILENNLGAVLKNVTAYGIFDALISPVPKHLPSEYVERNSKKNFINTLWNGI